MKKPLVLAASALFVLIGAAYPDTAKPGYSGDVASNDDGAPAPARYRPCRPGPGDDRCIQLYERGVRLAYARWLEGKPAQERETRVAQGGPYEPAARHRGRRHEHRAHEAQDSRCAGNPDADAVRGM